MRRRNGYRRIREQIVGSRAGYYKLGVYVREAINKTAKKMYDLGVDYQSATVAEATEKRGFVYVITHPSWPEYVKIGRAFDPESRLASMQTGCPVRSYQLKHEVYFEDCHFAEKEMHSRYDCVREQGEWFRMTVDQARSAINQLRSII